LLGIVARTKYHQCHSRTNTASQPYKADFEELFLATPRSKEKLVSISSIIYIVITLFEYLFVCIEGGMIGGGRHLTSLAYL
jgi:hypothetical protein